MTLDDPVKPLARLVQSNPRIEKEYKGITVPANHDNIGAFWSEW